ncbi:MAG TPA: lytic transglycosylase domain-containing protein [Burkholderiales bacterium]|nr:lytic transglycosylase domain-containing protein [Burkholderiales bacterium]
MTYRFRVLTLLAGMATCSGAAHAHLYGFVDGARVSVIFSDTQPADARYTLFSKQKPSPITEDAGEPQRGKGLTPTQFSGHILAAAKATKVDAALIHAVISVESGYNPSARSRAGAVGLMQLMPKTAKRYGVKNRLDPAQNIHGGARYLRDLKLQFDNDLQLVLAAYNAGEGAVMRFGGRIPPFRETLAYVPKVLSTYKQFRPATPSVPG